MENSLSEKPAVIFSASAAERVTDIARQQNKPAILRLSVEGGGCSGFRYQYSLADHIEAEDCQIHEGEATLIIDPVSLDLLAGSTVNFIKSLNGSAFQIENPNAVSGCGCGSSFSI
ncbi:MAG: iron-sulfur cluster assembly accessory protein [Zymomonas mobilis subsp. pomaceae]|uniref:Iron-sulfur cluster assembly accessory protein n=1 Tax=Zymomonas mobilis subsp. pomaceae (strain ATCC 29192 / DSM 22645 / JCM 10191 / CCUG 17912 / NBRC 13757 / NCIMB 11200 / NRRL B-4491 / Barker I) TaxID=579138 RepID=F8EWE2_ZYMMT|nr:iron-sulfur cluster assembly accessory protein [Zymomonas mobilis]AEI38552.1 iron-sulfur cluster assembly accessory protein [Zymomonas mobilis subsp. pomaceae ATCC 29192]MDX5948242.1 iron-sulfur cluster assembly accessory protein [Zymomonas mobilis subsp. pomaceae]GEB88997.1 heme biosynthesis protein HemY [Zymomonas mobilis subsp. pomaceae]